MGFIKSSVAEKFFRDSKIGKIYEGTSNICLQVIFVFLSSCSNQVFDHFCADHRKSNCQLKRVVPKKKSLNLSLLKMGREWLLRRACTTLSLLRLHRPISRVKVASFLRDGLCTTNKSVSTKQTNLPTKNPNLLGNRLFLQVAPFPSQKKKKRKEKEKKKKKKEKETSDQQKQTGAKKKAKEEQHCHATIPKPSFLFLYVIFFFSFFFFFFFLWKNDLWSGVGEEKEALRGRDEASAAGSLVRTLLPPSHPTHTPQQATTKQNKTKKKKTKKKKQKKKKKNEKKPRGKTFFSKQTTKKGGVACEGFGAAFFALLFSFFFFFFFSLSLLSSFSPFLVVHASSGTGLSRLRGFFRHLCTPDLQNKI